MDDGSAAEPVLFAMGRSTQITDPDSIARYLRHIGEPVAPPPLTPARGPPYYQSRVLRRRPSPQQTEMFDA